MNPKLPLNPGLVGIIGARGSGETALADFIAVGATAFTIGANQRSFIDRAINHLSGAGVSLEWADGTGSDCSIHALDRFEAADDPQVRYLSQQFVDRLCSAKGLTDELLHQRVVFLAHPTEDRMSATDFQQLLDLSAESARLARSGAEAELRALSDEFVTEREKQASVVPLRTRLAALQEQITKTQGDRMALVARGGGSAERLNQYATVAAALQARRSAYEQLERRKNALKILAEEVRLWRTRTFPDQLRAWKTRHQAAELPEALWPRFALQFTGDVNGAIAGEEARVNSAMSAVAGSPPSAPTDLLSAQTLLPVNVALQTLSIAILQAEARRLEALIGVDRETARALTLLNSRIATDEGQAANLRRQIQAAEKAPARLAEIRLERQAAYANVFNALIAEQTELTNLYAPLSNRIARETGAARKLSFDVRRRVDVEKWAERGEQLLDLRKGSILRRGSLADLARQRLSSAWATGTAADASAALAAFRDEYDSVIVECCPYNTRDPSAIPSFFTRTRTF